MTESAVTFRSSLSMRALRSAIVSEHHGRAGVLEQSRLSGGGLDDAAVGRKIPTQNKGRAGLGQGLIQRQDHRVIKHFGIGNLLPPACRLKPYGRGGAAAR